MTPPDPWLEPIELSSERLVLEPLRVEHAAEMVTVLDDPQLHTYIGGEPATLHQLTATYARQVVGHSADGSERWLNWIARNGDDGAAVGYVQASAIWEDGHPQAEVAWVIGSGHQGRGYAGEAAGAMVDWLRSQGIELVVAHVHPEHLASLAVARTVGLHPTDQVVDGEIRWEG